jgi:hypothetical protein
MMVINRNALLPYEAVNRHNNIAWWKCIYSQYFVMKLWMLTAYTCIFSSTKAAMNIIIFKNKCFLFYLNIQNIHIKQDKKHTSLRNKSKDLLSRNQDDKSQWSNMSTRGLLLKWATVDIIVHQICFFSLYISCKTWLNNIIKGRSSKYQFHNLRFDPFGAWIHDIPHSRRAR